MAGYVLQLRNDRAQAILTNIGSAGKLKLMGGTRPATGAASTNVLGTLLLKNPAGTINNAVLSFTKPDDAQATGTGVATWARVTDASDNPVVDLSVSDTTGNGEVKVNDTNIEPSLWMSVQAMQVTEGNP